MVIKHYWPIDLSNEIKFRKKPLKKLLWVMNANASNRVLCVLLSKFRKVETGSNSATCYIKMHAIVTHALLSSPLHRTAKMSHVLESCVCFFR